MQNAYSGQTRGNSIGRLCLSIGVSRGDRDRRFAIGHRAALATFAILIAMAAWGLAAGFYVFFHDDLLASLMARQANMQYSYEDQIAVLHTEVDRESSRNLIDQRTIETALHDLAARAARLEARASAIDKVVDDGASGQRSAPASSAIPGDEPTTLQGRSIAGDRVELETGPISRQLAQVEARQVETLTHIREPLLRKTERLASALAQVGLLNKSGGGRQSEGTGGPFVPLQGSADDFDVQIALVNSAIQQRDQLASLVDHAPLRKPLKGALEVTSPFGARLDPFLGRPAMHTGIDLMQHAGDAVYATGSGTVTIAAYNGGYGDMVEIDHGNGLVTRYAHLSSIEVALHQHVSAGSVIGRVGATGRATGPHLHYETRINGQPVDPTRFLNAAMRLARD